VKWMKTFHATVATPIESRELFGGRVIWVCLRGTFAASVFLAVAAILGGGPSPWGLLAVPAAVLGAAVFAAWLSGWAVQQESDVPFAVLTRVGLFPLFMFSGTFFPTSRLPDWLQPLTWLSPLWHTVELCRAATTGSQPSVGTVFAHVAILGGLLAVGWWWGARRFAKALAP